jgi:hypothetical protein
LNYEGHDGDDLSTDPEDVEYDVTQNLDEYSEDDIMQALEHEVKNAFIHDSENDIEDGAFQKSKAHSSSLQATIQEGSAPYSNA